MSSPATPSTHAILATFVHTAKSFQNLKTAILASLQADKLHSTHDAMKEFFNVLEETPANINILKRMRLHIKLLQRLPVSDNVLREWLAKELLPFEIKLGDLASFVSAKYYTAMHKILLALPTTGCESKVDVLNFMCNLIIGLMKLEDGDSRTQAVELFEAGLEHFNMQSEILALITRYKQELKLDTPRVQVI